MAQIFTAILVIVVSSLAASASAGDPASNMTLAVILEQPVMIPSPDAVITSVLLTFPAGDPGIGPHTHSGPVVGYVVEGEFLFQVNGEPQRILPAGSSFFENVSAVHIWGGNASNSTICKVVATVYGKPNEPATTVLDNYPRESREEALSLAKSANAKDEPKQQ